MSQYIIQLISAQCHILYGKQSVNIQCKCILYEMESLAEINRGPLNCWNLLVFLIQYRNP